MSLHMGLRWAVEGLLRVGCGLSLGEIAEMGPNRA